VAEINTTFKTAIAAEKSEEMREGRYPFAFWLGNGFVAAFFYGTWLLSWWVPVIEHWQDSLSDFQLCTASFVSFFTASFIPIRLAHIKFAALKSIGFALLFWFFLFCLIVISIMALGPWMPLD